MEKTVVTHGKTKRMLKLGQEAMLGDSMALIALGSAVNAMDLRTAREYAIAGFLLAAEMHPDTTLARRKEESHDPH